MDAGNETRILSKLDDIQSDLQSVKLTVERLAGNLGVQEAELRNLSGIVAEAKQEAESLAERVRLVESKQSAEAARLALHNTALWALFGVALSSAAGVVVGLLQRVTGG